MILPGKRGFAGAYQPIDLELFDAYLSSGWRDNLEHPVCVPLDVISMAKRSNGHVLRKYLNGRRPPLLPPSDLSDKLEATTRRVQITGEALQEQDSSIQMRADLCRRPLVGRDLLARQEYVGLITQLAKDAETKLLLWSSCPSSSHSRMSVLWMSISPDIAWTTRS